MVLWLKKLGPYILDIKGIIVLLVISQVLCLKIMLRFYKYLTKNNYKITQQPKIKKKMFANKTSGMSNTFCLGATPTINII